MRTDGRPVGPAGDRSETGDGRALGAKPRVRSLAAGLTAQRAAEHDQVGALLAQRFVVEPPASHRAGREALDHDVRPIDQAFGDRTSGFGGKVERHAQLRGVEVPGQMSAIDPGNIVLEGWDHAQHVQPRLGLDLDHGGAVVRQRLADERPGGDPGEVRHPYPGKRVRPRLGPDHLRSRRPARRFQQRLIGPRRGGRRAVADGRLGEHRERTRVCSAGDVAPVATVVQLWIDQQVGGRVGRREQELLRNRAVLEFPLRLPPEEGEQLRQAPADLLGGEAARGEVLQPRLPGVIAEILVERSLLGGPAHHARERAVPHVAQDQRHHGPSVGRLGDRRDAHPRRDLARRGSACGPGARWVAAGQRWGPRSRQQCPDHGRLHRRVEMLPQARTLAFVERDDRVRGGLRGAMERRLRVSDRYRRAIAVALESQEPGRRLHGQIGGRRRRMRARLPERGDRDVEQARVDRAQCFVSQAEAIHVPGLGGLHHDVRTRDQLLQSLAIVGVIDVEYDAALSQRHRGPEQRSVGGVFATGDERGHPSRRRAPGRLDLDDLRAEVRQDATRQLAPGRGEIDHTDTVQRPTGLVRSCHVAPPVAAAPVGWPRRSRAGTRCSALLCRNAAVS